MNPENRDLRNPFGVMDVPAPNDEEVCAFAATATVTAGGGDDNAAPWSGTNGNEFATIEGAWSSRWNGGADPTIPDDAPEKWKQGHGEVKTSGERVYLLFVWDNGARKGLIDAQRQGPQRLVGKYINLSDPTITRPWIGQIVSNRRIDGRWTGGRLDFRR